jgi:hypothetical protein
MSNNNHSSSNGDATATASIRQLPTMSLSGPNQSTPTSSSAITIPRQQQYTLQQIREIITAIMKEAVKNPGYTQNITFDDGHTEVTRGIIGVVSFFFRPDLNTSSTGITRITLVVDNQEQFMKVVYVTLQRDYPHLFVLKCPRFPGGYVNNEGSISRSEQGVRQYMIDEQLLSTFTSECYQLPHITQLAVTII